MDRVFKIALLVSIAGHSMFLYGWPGFAHILPDKRVENPLEITYYEIKQAPITSPLIKEKETLSPRNFKAYPVKSALGGLSDGVKKEQRAKTELTVARITPGQKETLTAHSHETLETPDEKSLYLDYYQSIREKIRSVANYNYSDYSNIGQIYLSFILGFGGNLKNIELFDNKSNPDRTLRRIALNSVREASPFSPFPEGLNQKQLSFNVIISFEREN